MSLFFNKFYFSEIGEALDNALSSLSVYVNSYKLAENNAEELYVKNFIYFSMVDNITFSDQDELILNINSNEGYAKENKLATYIKHIFSLMTLKQAEHMPTSTMYFESDLFFSDAASYFRTYESFVQNDLILRSSRRDKEGTVEHEISSKKLRITGYRPFYMVINKLTQNAYKTYAA